MGRSLRFGQIRYSGLAFLLVFALTSCATEQAGPTGEEDAADPVTREITKTVTVAEAPEQKKVAPTPSRTARPADAPAEGALAYLTVADGALSVEVPSSWGEVETGEESEAGRSWSEFVGESVESSITAAPSLDSWNNAPGSPGIYGVVSAELAQQYANEELVASGPNDLSGTCEAGARRALERVPYSGLSQEWVNCQDGDGYLTMAATPNDAECVVILQVGTTGQEGAEAGQHALETFEAGCRGAPYSRANADEQYADDSDLRPTPPREEGEDKVACSGFTTMSGEPSQWQAQQFYDSVATPGERAILDPDGDGFACDGTLSEPEGIQYEPETTEPGASEPPPDDEERVPPPTDQYSPLEPSPPLPGDEVTDEPPVPSEPPPSSSGYPPFPGDPFNGPTCEEVGGGPYSVPPGSPRDANGDGVACE